MVHADGQAACRDDADLLLADRCLCLGTNMPVWLITFGKSLLALPTWAKAAIGIVVLAAIIVGYIAWQRHTISELEDDLNQAQVNRAMDEVNALTNKIEEGKKEDVKLSENSNLAERNSADISNRDSNTFTGERSKLLFCQRYCRDSLCEEYRRVHECR